MVGDGSTQKNLNTKVVGGVKVLIPTDNHLLKVFDESVNSLFSMILTLAKQNQKLKKARDLLLPRLMNGEINV